MFIWVWWSWLLSHLMLALFLNGSVLFLRDLLGIKKKKCKCNFHGVRHERHWEETEMKSWSLRGRAVFLWRWSGGLVWAPVGERSRQHPTRSLSLGLTFCLSAVSKCNCQHRGAVVVLTTSFLSLVTSTTHTHALVCDNTHTYAVLYF